MSGFQRHTGTIAVYNVDDVDTDRIIPARFLSRVSRFGYGELLFADVRDADFPLKKPEAKGATVLVAGTNFGCGSSREHAVWAIQQAGFRICTWYPSEVAPEDIAQYGEAYWQDWRENCLVIGLVCQK